MKLRYIAISLAYDYPTSKEYRYEFECHSRYICNFLSKAIRKYKIEVEETYNMILITLGKEELPKVHSYSKCLQISLPFDKSWYEKVKGTEDTSYYIHVLNLGLKQAFEYSHVAHSYLESLMNEFTETNGVNEWVHKKKVFKEIGLKVEMVCRFTTNDFKLFVRFIDAKSKKLIREVLTISSYPDEIAFDFCFRDIICFDNRIWITDFQNRPYLYVDVDNLHSSELKFSYTNKFVNDEDHFNLLVKNTSVDLPKD